MLPAPELAKTRHVQTHAAFFQRVLDSMHVPFMMHLDEVEKTLFEAIILHRMTFHFNHPNLSDFERRSHSVLLAMSKRKLVELFLDLDPKDVPSVFEISDMKGIRSHIWSTSCEHARACTQAMNLVGQMDEYWMYQTSIYEMYMLGIDFVIFNEVDETVYCVQVKPSSQADLDFNIEQILLVPGMETESIPDDWTRRLNDGTIRMHQHYPGYVFRPYRITISPSVNTQNKAIIAKAKYFFLCKPQLASNTDKEAAA